MSKKLILILGGARGGKSSYAQARAQELGGKEVLYVATAQALDEEMQARIFAHQLERPQSWRTLEAPTLQGALLAKEAHEAKVVLLECLTLLVSNAIISALGEFPTKDEGTGAIGAELLAKESGAEVVPLESLTVECGVKGSQAEVIAQAEAAVELEIKALLTSMSQTEASWIVVSNEVGLGIVPDNLLARVYRDVLGKANQRLATIADEVVLLIAGLSLRLK